MKLGRIEIEASRWPWQGYGWFPHKNGKGPTALLNSSGARFGGGWKYKLGVSLSGRTLMLDLMFGIVCVRVKEKP